MLGLLKSYLEKFFSQQHAFKILQSRIKKNSVAN